LVEWILRAHIPSMTELALFGVIAGILTTLTGQGGGLFLLLVLSYRVGPHAALALSSPALLFGNLHRVLTFRKSIVISAAVRFSVGALPGSILGGFFASAMPARIVQTALLLMTAVTLAKALGLLRFELSPVIYPWAGLSLGFLTGTSGGAGILVSPVLLASGLSGAPYIATQSVIAVTMHLGRIVAYGYTGLFQGTVYMHIATVTFSIFAGNIFADRIKRRMTSTAISRIEYVTLIACTLLAVTGSIGRNK
jgi:uncharacterized protein